MEKMDNKAIQKLRELYFKVCTRLYVSNFLQYIILSKLTKLHVPLGTCWRLFFSEFLVIAPGHIRNPGIDHFTVACSVFWPLNGSEAGGDLA